MKHTPLNKNLNNSEQSTKYYTKCIYFQNTHRNFFISKRTKVKQGRRNKVKRREKQNSD